MTPTLRALLSRIATAYDALPHMPTDTAVVRAYGAFKAQLLQQYRTIPYQVVYTSTDPYPDSATMFRDVEASGILRVYTGDELPIDHPMREAIPRGYRSSALVSYNYVFRAVHDALVHIPNRYGFGPVGEFRAFQAHAELIAGFPYLPGVDTDSIIRDSFQAGYEPWIANAIRALATETLAQNAWFNTIGQISCDSCLGAGTYDDGITTCLDCNGRKIVPMFAPQKACLLPDALIVEALEFQI